MERVGVGDHWPGLGRAVTDGRGTRRAGFAMLALHGKVAVDCRSGLISVGGGARRGRGCGCTNAGPACGRWGGRPGD